MKGVMNKNETFVLLHLFCFDDKTVNTITKKYKHKSN